MERGSHHPAAGSSAIHAENGSEPWKIPADESVLRLTTIIINDRGTKERGPTIVAFSQGLRIYTFSNFPHVFARLINEVSNTSQ